MSKILRGIHLSDVQKISSHRAKGEKNKPLIINQL
jgi:hypothetical protein